MNGVAAIKRRVLLLLALTVVLPLALALAGAAWRAGVLRREAAAERDRTTAQRLIESYSGEPAVLHAADAGYDAAFYSGSARAHTTAAELPATVPDAWLRALRARDRALSVRLADGRAAALAPIKDADQWELTGALLVVPRGLAAPPLSPRARQQYALWLGGLLVAWLVFAAIGVSLVRLAREPLRLGESVRAWLFLAPSFAHLLLFSIGPILFSLFLSFHEWNLLEPERPFVGFDNYRTLARDASFWRAVLNTGLYVLFVPVAMVLALGLALLVNRRGPGTRLLRTVYFLPYITSFVAISIVWGWMYEPSFGLLNNLLARLGLPAQPWLTSPRTALPSLMLLSTWLYAGYMMVIFLAGLQSIPQSLYESATIDGAGRWQRFRRVTLPLLRPTTFFVLVTMVIFMFQVFTAVYVMTEGGPLHSTNVIVYHIYRTAWEYLRMGYASAMAWVLFMIVFLVTLLQFRVLGSRYAHE